MPDREYLGLQGLLNERPEGLCEGDNDIALCKMPGISVDLFCQGINLYAVFPHQVDQADELTGIMLFLWEDIIIGSLG